MNLYSLKFIRGFYFHDWGFLGASVVKNLPANAGNLGLIPELEKSRGGWNSNPLQYSCLEVPWTEDTGWLQSKGLQRVRHD